MYYIYTEKDQAQACCRSCVSILVCQSIIYCPKTGSSITLCSVICMKSTALLRTTQTPKLLPLSDHLEPLQYPNPPGQKERVCKGSINAHQSQLDFPRCLSHRYVTLYNIKTNEASGIALRSWLLKASRQDVKVAGISVVASKRRQFLLGKGG